MFQVPNREALSSELASRAPYIYPFCEHCSWVSRPLREQWLAGYALNDTRQGSHDVLLGLLLKGRGFTHMHPLTCFSDGGSSYKLLYTFILHNFRNASYS